MVRHIFSYALCAGWALAACTYGQDAVSNIETPEILRWTAPNADIVSILAVEPAECLPEAASVTEHTQITLGRMAFRSPFLLGGQAARRGLTCQSCHTNGQINTAFSVVGLSDAPGTADVTSFHFSDELGDEVFNPAPIPNLSDAEQGVNYDPERPDLAEFVHRLITKEFTGAAPIPDVEAGLLRYLRALDTTQCQNPEYVGEAALAHRLSVIDDAVLVLIEGGLSSESAMFLARSTRVELGRIHNRFPGHKKIRGRLGEISRTLEAGDYAHTHRQWSSLKSDISAAFTDSLFHAPKTKNWLQARQE